MRRFLLVFAAGVLTMSMPAMGDTNRGAEILRLPALFSDHAVLQRGAPVPVWGWAESGRTVRVSASWSDKIWNAGADSNGLWRMTLDREPAGPGPFELAVTDGVTTQTVRDILFGEVWLISGQSNANFPLSATADAKQELPRAKDKKIRFFFVPARVSLQPQSDVASSWKVCTPESAAGISAAGYYFARRVHAEKNVPVGLIHSAYGGAVAEAWINPGALKKDPALQTILATWEQFVRDYPATPEARRARGQQNEAKLRAAGKPVPPWPLEPKAPDHFHRPGGLYHGMIAPLIPFSLRGVLWYQGEANAWRAQQYETLLPALIADWRAEWGRPDLPFLIVQLPNFAAEWLEEPFWAEMREAQLRVWQKVPHTALIPALDVGNPVDIHPTNKRPVGERLAAAALAEVYGGTNEFSGPVFKALAREPGRVRLTFDHAAGGLTGKDGALREFSAAGTNKIFQPVKAEIDGESIVIAESELPGLVAVRYAWRNAPEVNVYNRAGLPVLPFRTDNWPGVTEGNHTPEEY